MMKRRDYLTNLGIATTAPLAVGSAEEAAGELQDDSSILGDRINEGSRLTFRRGVEGDVLVSVDKFDEVERPEIIIRFQNSSISPYKFPLQEDAPEPHVGDTIALVYHNRPFKKTYLIEYYGGIHRVKGWFRKEGEQ